MVAWTIGIEIGGSRIDAEGLLRLLAALKRDVPDFEADCALWSGRLAVHGTVAAETPGEALASALATVSSAFDAAGLDARQESEITSVTLRRARAATSRDAHSLSYALLHGLRKRSHANR